MSITKSYNKHNGVYYAYDTQYVWNEKLQKKVQQKKCIGKYDPVTGEIVPNGKRGRPYTAPGTYASPPETVKKTNPVNNSEVQKLAVKIRAASDAYEELGKRITELTSDMNALLSHMTSE